MNELRRWQLIFWAGAAVVAGSLAGFSTQVLMDRQARESAPPVAIPTPAS